MIGKMSAGQRVLLRWVLRHTLLTPGRPRSPTAAPTGAAAPLTTVGLRPPSVSGGQPPPDQRAVSRLGILISLETTAVSSMTTPGSRPVRELDCRCVLILIVARQSSAHPRSARYSSQILGPDGSAAPDHYRATPSCVRMPSGNDRHSLATIRCASSPAPGDVSREKSPVRAVPFPPPGTRGWWRPRLLSAARSTWPDC